MTVVEHLRRRARDWELTAVARSDAGLLDEAKVAAIVAVVLFEISEAQEEAEDE